MFISETSKKLTEVNKRLMTLFKADQETMIAFRNLSKTTAREGNVSVAMKEMIAVAIGAAKGSDDCILFHVNEVKKHGGSRETLVEVLSIAIEISGGPGAVYSAKAVDDFDNL